MVTHRVRIAIVVGALTAIAVAIILLLSRNDSTSSTGTGSAVADLSDPLIVEFRETERICIAAFNDALARQGRNEIDELGLAHAIEQDALTPWQALRAKVAAASPSPRNAALYVALHRYLVARETAWQAYAAALRSPDTEARRHYDAYRAKNAEADAVARELGAIFRAAQ